MLGEDDLTAAMLLGGTVPEMLEYLCRSGSGRIPRGKDLLARVAAIDPNVAALAGDFYRAVTVAERARVALEIADRTIGARGFFPWDSGPGPVPD